MDNCHLLVAHHRYFYRESEMRMNDKFNTIVICVPFFRDKNIVSDLTVHVTKDSIEYHLFKIAPRAGNKDLHMLSSIQWLCEVMQI